MSKNIILRRDLEPLWLKAREVLLHYETAAGCIAAVMEADCTAEDFSKHPKAHVFCSLCMRYQQQHAPKAHRKYPCFPLHRSAAKKACKIGGSYIYTCPVGFSFWTSPIFAGERFAGAFISSVIPSLGRQEALDRLFRICKGDISRAEIARQIEEVPARTDSEILALARMMRFCAEHVSVHGPEGHETKQEKHAGLCQCCNQEVCQSKHSYVNLLDNERLLLASLRRGDKADALMIVEKMLDKLNSNNVEQFKLKAIELIVLLSRTGSHAHNEKSTEDTSRFVTRIMHSETIDEVSQNLHMVVEQMTGMIFSFRGIRHASALRKAERFIWKNYTRKISLKEVANVAGLSAPYFSTVFKEEMRENFSHYLNRLRVEKASAMLRETECPINHIAAACGFEDQSWFSKIFKSFTGLSPCKYREIGGVMLPAAGKPEE